MERALPFNKLVELEDFSHPELTPVIRDVCSHKVDYFPNFPQGAEHRKDWEVAMAVRALRHFGALHPGATVLGVAAGIEDTIFYLTRHVRQVFVTDRYLAPGNWGEVAPLAMLIDPASVTHSHFDPDRLVAQHMDGRLLLYPSDTFDGIFSSGSIEHFGDLHDVAAAAYEMGRVLKPGGVLSLSTEIGLAGPPGGIGWPGATLVFSADTLRQFIVEASGLELVDELQTHVSERTLSTPRDLTRVLIDRDTRDWQRPGGPEAPDYAHWDFPHLVLLHDGYVFTSVHLTLRKTDRYPAVANDWAKPTPELIEAIRRDNVALLSTGVGVPAAEPPPAAAPAASSWEEQKAATQRLLTTIDAGCHAVVSQLGELAVRREATEEEFTSVERYRREAAQSLAEVAALEGQSAQWWSDVQARLQHRRPEAPARSESSTDEVCCEVELPRGLRASIMIDPRVGDHVTASLRQGRSLDEPLIDLMLSVIRPGQRILDLGAHVGTFALAAAAAGAAALAVEGSPRNVELLRASVARNGFKAVRVVHAAASDDTGTVEFIDYGPWGRISSDPAHPAFMAPAEVGRPTVAVPAVTLTELLVELGWLPVSFVKMDVEGAEIRVLRGMKDLLAGPDAPPILYESNGYTLNLYGTTPGQLMAELEALGYTSYLVGRGRLVRTSSEELQPENLVDYLAVKRLPMGGVAGWTIDDAMDPDERISRLVADARSPNPDHRAYVARALAGAGADILSDLRIVDTLGRLAGDSVDDVRMAMQWWTEKRLELERQ